jgi:hypothetical protein
MANLRHRRLVIFLNVLARAGDGQLVEQGKKACGKLVEQCFGVALAATRSCRRGTRCRTGQGWRFGPVAKGFCAAFSVCLLLAMPVLCMNAWSCPSDTS